MFIFLFLFLFLFSTATAMNVELKTIEKSPYDDNWIIIMLYSLGENPTKNLTKFALVSKRFKKLTDSISQNYIPGILAYKMTNVLAESIQIVTKGIELSKDDEINKDNFEKMLDVIIEKKMNKAKINDEDWSNQEKRLLFILNTEVKRWHLISVLTYANSIAKKGASVQKFLEKKILSECAQKNKILLNVLKRLSEKTNSFSSLWDTRIKTDLINSLTFKLPHTITEFFNKLFNTSTVNKFGKKLSNFNVSSELFRANN
jgi:hypothetical protein